MKIYRFPFRMSLIVSVLFASTAFSQVYELTDLGFTPASISDSVKVAGYYWSGGEYTRAYLWENGSSRDIGVPESGGYSAARSINNSGKIVGTFWPQNDYSQKHAFIWENGVMTDLGTLGGLSSEGSGVNDSGHVVGWSLRSDSTLNDHAFFWKNGTMTDLGTLGGEASGAAGINDLGQVVGHSRIADSVNIHGFIWQDGGMQDLGTLGGNASTASAINNLGHIVGFSTDANDRGAGFIMQGGSMTELGAIAIPPGFDYGTSVPYDVNELDEVVGQSTWSEPPNTHGYHAFIWKNGIMTDLNSVTDTSGGWILTRATGINNRGDIVGVANYHGVQRGILLKRTGIALTEPKRGEFWISGDQDTIRWKSGLAPDEQVILHYSLDDGQTWSILESNLPADSEMYVWTIPDTISSQARILISSLNDFAVNDTSDQFTVRGYVLSKLSETSQNIVYNSLSDRWAFGNISEDIWPPAWYDRFDYTGVDSFTGKSYLSGSLYASYVFLTAERSDFPDWPSFVNAFAPYNCYLNQAQGIYSPTAVAKWASIKGDWGGSCFGFAISNAIVFRNKGNFETNYPGFPSFNYPHEISTDMRAIPVVNELFTHQYGNPHAAYVINVGFSKTPTQTFNELKTMLLSDNEPVRTLSIFNNGPGGGGHAVLPYKLKQDPDQRNLYYLNVYDNAYPDVLDAQITIDTAQNSGNGSWDYPLWPGWGGANWLLLMDPAINYLSYPQLPKNAPKGGTSPFTLAVNVIEINPVRSASVRIRDAQGRETGYFDSLIHADIPGSHPRVTMNGSKTPPYGYRLPNSAYSVSMSNFSQGTSQTFLFTENKTFGVQRMGAAGNETDRFFFDGGLSVTNPDTITKSFDVSNIINEATSYGREKVYAVRGLDFLQHDSVKVENINTDGLKLSSFDPTARSYRLDIEYDSYYTGVGRFTHVGVPLAANSAHLIQPNWTSLNSGGLTILIDNGNDGTIDDSMLVDNQVTGVQDPRVDRIPSTYALHQNYPNPFNPITTIQYDLPRTSHVTLKVYNVLGEEVVVLVDGMQEAGYRTVEWNAGKIPSGVYFYRLQADNYIQTKKLILLR